MYFNLRSVHTIKQYFGQKLHKIISNSFTKLKDNGIEIVSLRFISLTELRAKNLKFMMEKLMSKW